MIFSSCPKRLGFSKSQGSPKSFPTAFSHPRMKHIRISLTYGPQRHLISILGDVLWFERAPLPGEHYCSHVPQLFVELQQLVRIMKPPKLAPASHVPTLGWIWCTVPELLCLGKICQDQTRRGPLPSTNSIQNTWEAPHCDRLQLNTFL